VAVKWFDRGRHRADVVHSSLFHYRYAVGIDWVVLTLLLALLVAREWSGH
jgi:hypothetical protein